MFHSETLARVIHADRVRDLDRAAESRRLLAGTDVLATPALTAMVRTAPVAASGPATATCRPTARDGSAGAAA